MSKITQLVVETNPVSTDRIEMVKDPAGTPLSRGVDFANIPKAFKALINPQTGTSYTLQDSDNGYTVTLDNASAITLTVPSGLGAGFACMLLQLGTGQVTVVSSGTTVNNRQSHTKIAGRYGMATLMAYLANTFAFGGDTSA